jgi:hypothetical protein
MKRCIPVKLQGVAYLCLSGSICALYQEGDARGVIKQRCNYDKVYPVSFLFMPRTNVLTCTSKVGPQCPSILVRTSAERYTYVFKRVLRYFVLFIGIRVHLLQKVDKNICKRKRTNIQDVPKSLYRKVRCKNHLGLPLKYCITKIVQNVSTGAGSFPPLLHSHRNKFQLGLQFVTKQSYSFLLGKATFGTHCTLRVYLFTCLFVA